MWRIFKKRKSEESHFNAEKVFLASVQPLQQVYDYFETKPGGLSQDTINERLKKYGVNEVVREKATHPLMLFIRAFINPFIGVLMVLAIVSLVIDVIMAPPTEQEWTSVAVITVMVVLSAILKFTQELKSSRASSSLQKLVTNTASVYRDGSLHSQEVDMRDIVPGDIIYLSAGDMIPADVRVIECKDLFVGQSSLTGESDGIEKFPTEQPNTTKRGSVIDLDNICFMGSNVISGYAKAIVIQTGNDTYLGTIAKSIAGVRAQTAFDKGVSNVSLLLIRFMIVMVPFVFLINGITKGDWFDAFLFAISIAVGLTPEMLPMIVTANLSKGTIAMAKKKTIVKNLNSIQNFGAMNILCTDKTGTLTRDEVLLEKHINVEGEEDVDQRVLRHAYLNSYFQTGLRNLIDRAILSHVEEQDLQYVREKYIKIDEIPFDFTRRRLSVILEDKSGKRQIVTKGAVEEMLTACSHVEYKGQVYELTKDLEEKALAVCGQLNAEGMRVLAIAQKSWVTKDKDFAIEDESEMVLIGFLAFLDPPKPSTATAIQKLHQHGVEVKVLSGDNEAVVKTICRQVGIDTSHSLNGMQVEGMTDEQLKEVLMITTVFSKLDPMQKTRIIRLLQELDNTVGFLGDGINDAAALRQSDVGISVENAVDIAKESADIILLEKDLMVLEDGVIEGRKTFGNIIKYIKMTASSNFGNMFSVLGASAFLPFLPMLPIHLLVQNLLYDVSQSTIPFDTMDEEYLRNPKKWDATDLKKFMLYIGPISSIFDILTFIILWTVFAYNTPEKQAFFQSAWFVEGLLSQTLIVHMIRTRKIPFLQSNASWPVTSLTLAICVIGLILPFSGLGSSIGLVPLPWSYFPWLMAILVAYGVLTQVVKQWYIKKFHSWL